MKGTWEEIKGEQWKEMKGKRKETAPRMNFYYKAILHALQNLKQMYSMPQNPVKR